MQNQQATPTKRGRPRRETADTRTTAQRKQEKAAARRARGLIEAESLHRLPDHARVRMPALEVLLSCSAPTIWRRVQAGKLPRPARDGSLTYWRAADVRAALEAM